MNDTPHRGGAPPPVPLDALDRTLAPPPEVEDRVVERLRADGLLAAARPRPGERQGGAGATAGGAMRGTSRRLSRFARGGWLAAAAAAAVALFAGGYAMGQAAGTRTAVETLTALGGADPAERAAALQRTGSLYVRAVTALEGSDPSAAGHEVALATLRAAAAELARLSPDDARLARVLALLGGRESTPPDGTSRTLLWF